METKKLCPKCRRLKNRDEFYKSASKSDGLQSRCKKCHNEAIASNPPKPEARYSRLKAWRKAHTEKAKEYSKRYKDKHQNTPEGRQRRALARYGLTEEQYTILVTKHKGRCHLCKRKPKTRMHVDHCHKTKRVRGFLCLKCNVGLGHFNDDPELLRMAIEYLENT